MSAGKQRLDNVRRQVPRSKGWNDADAMRALDKRARLDCPDGSLRTWQDQGGMHAQINQPEPIVTYDADAEQWTVHARLFSIMATDQAQKQGGDVFSGENSGRDYCIQLGHYVFDRQEGTFSVDFVIPAHNPSMIADTLSRLIYWSSAEDTADICTDAGTLWGESYHGHESGLNTVLWSVSFFADGTWSSSFETVPLQFAYQRAGQPTTVMRYQPPIAPITTGVVRAKKYILPGLGEYELAQASVPAETNDDIVMVWHKTRAIIFGLLADLQATYGGDITGDVITLGKITTDADGMCTQWIDYTGCQQLWPGGLSQDVTIDGTTLTFNHGLLTAVS